MSDSESEIMRDTPSNIPFLFCRFIDPDDLYNGAVKFLEEERSKEYDRLDPNRDNLFITLHPDDLPEDLKDVTDVNILEDLIQQKVKKIGSFRFRDRNLMAEFVKKNRAALLPNLQIDIRGYLLGRSPLYLYLCADSFKDNTNWHYPSASLIHDICDSPSIDQKTAKQVIVHELTINVDSDHEFKMFQKWCLQHHKDNQDRFPTGLISLDVEEIKISKSSFETLKQRVQAGGDDQPLKIPVPSFYEKNATNIPAKIMFGDGRTWMGIIRLNWNMEVNKDGTRYYLLDTTPIESHHTALVMLSLLKCFTGQGILNDRNNLQDFFKTVYDIEPKLPMCVDMDAISHAAGYRLRKSGMFITNLTVMGGLLNKEVSCADGTWCEKYENLSSGMKAYIIGDIRVGYTNSIVLLSLLMKNIFPDPYILCSVLKLDQKSAARWFCQLVFCCLSELGINPSVKANASTRQDLIYSLRAYTDTYPRQMTKQPPTETRLFSKLIPDWPTVPYGGPRELHQVAAFFVDQYRTLQELVAYDSDFQDLTTADLRQEVTEDFIKSITFGNGTQREFVCPGMATPGLQVRESRKLFQLQTSDMSNEAIEKEHKRVGRTKELAILELMRVNPTARSFIIYKLSTMDLFDKKHSFWLTRLSLYDKIKTMCSIMNDKPALGIPVLEDQIEKRAKTVTSQETATRKKDELILNNRLKREVLFSLKKQRAERNTGGKRTGLQQEVYNIIPGDNLIANQKARRNKKRRMNYISRLPDFIPQDDWDHMKRTGQNPVRATFRNFKKCGFDLRDVLKEQRKKKTAKDQVVAERQAQEGKPFSANLNKSPRPGPSTAAVNDDSHNPGPSCSTIIENEERTIKYVEISDDEELETVDTDNNLQNLFFDPNSADMIANPHMAHFFNPMERVTSRRTPVNLTETAKWTSKGKGKGKSSAKGTKVNKGTNEMKLRPAELSSSDSDYDYVCDFE